MLHSDLGVRNFESISSRIKNKSPPSLEFLSNLYGRPYLLKSICPEGNESLSFVSNNKTMSRFPLMTSSKNSNLFLMESMFKCPTISLFAEFSWIFFRPNFSFIDSINGSLLLIISMQWISWNFFWTICIGLYLRVSFILFLSRWVGRNFIW